MKTAALALLLLPALAGSALAQTSYVGIGPVAGRISIPEVATTFGTNTDTHTLAGSGDRSRGVGYKLHIGYEFPEYLGVEFGYLDLGNYSVKGTLDGVPFAASASEYSIYAAATARVALPRKFTVFGKLGVVNSLFERTSACAGTYCRSFGTMSRFQILYGVGASYAISPKWSARLEYEDLGSLSQNDFWGTSAGAVKGRAVTLSGQYTF